ncbi:MAG TPA: hypothetical protein IAC64_09205, partial [Candidatus Caccomorpha excrementavium]|nr:hypothetical protein [Candidatus Caccomorpha excrementavium]
NYTSVFESKIRYYITYADGITMGVRPIVEMDPVISDEEVEKVFSNIYPIIQDENGIAYITLSNFDVENMYKNTQ